MNELLMESCGGSKRILQYAGKTLLVDFDTLANIEINKPNTFGYRSTVVFTDNTGFQQIIQVDQSEFVEYSEFTKLAIESWKGWVRNVSGFVNDGISPTVKYYADGKYLSVKWGSNTVIIHRDGLETVKHLGDQLIIGYGNRQVIRLVSARVDFLDIVNKEIQAKLLA
ncbi:hypothetical protein TOTORO_00610 [Serratia phage vB_SmaS-Totoro]|nr:hypothetical protein TOTORO_00610 [Serratia phage vB_SmaS-Totoro]